MVERKHKPPLPDVTKTTVAVRNRVGSGRRRIELISGVLKEGPMDVGELRNLIDSTPRYNPGKRSRHRKGR